MVLSFGEPIFKVIILCLISINKTNIMVLQGRLPFHILEGVDFEDVPTLVLHWHHLRTVEFVQRLEHHKFQDVFGGHCWSSEVAQEGLLGQVY